jgi:hypothetical protein
MTNNWFRERYQYSLSSTANAFSLSLSLSLFLSPLPPSPVSPLPSWKADCSRPAGLLSGQAPAAVSDGQYALMFVRGCALFFLWRVGAVAAWWAPLHALEIGGCMLSGGHSANRMAGLALRQGGVSGWHGRTQLWLAARGETMVRAIPPRGRSYVTSIREDMYEAYRRCALRL